MLSLDERTKGVRCTGWQRRARGSAHARGTASFAGADSLVGWLVGWSPTDRWPYPGHVWLRLWVQPASTHARASLRRARRPATQRGGVERRTIWYCTLLRDWLGRHKQVPTNQSQQWCRRTRRSPRAAATLRQKLSRPTFGHIKLALCADARRPRTVARSGNEGVPPAGSVCGALRAARAPLEQALRAAREKDCARALRGPRGSGGAGRSPRGSPRRAPRASDASAPHIAHPSEAPLRAPTGIEISHTPSSQHIKYPASLPVNWRKCFSFPFHVR